MRILALLSSFLTTLFLTSCTISVIDTHNEQGSTDSITETQKATPKISSALNVPVQSPSSSQNVTVPPKTSSK